MLAVNERDRLLGAEAITNFINNELLDPECAVTLKAVQHWIDRDMIPTGRFGRQIVGSKIRIRAALSDETTPQRPMPALRMRRHLYPGKRGAS